ncbi:MAG TPA: DUF3298 domain-containing protein [Vineibacter sp.]|nr:DUF3298 domain-containing protein [Vineibacter sp.]
MRPFDVMIGLALAGLATDAAAQTSPSFDCSKATTAIEKTICADKDAAAADRAMADAYRRLLESLGNPAARTHLQRDQMAWLTDRQRICGSPSGAAGGRTMPLCLTELATARAERLAALPAGNAYSFVGERRLVERGRRGGVSYNIAVSYAVFEFADINYAGVNGTIKAWAEKFAADVRPSTQGNAGGPTEIGWFLDSGHVVHAASRDLVTVAAHWLLFTGGAHPNNGRIAWQVALTSGSLLRLDDIFGPASLWPEAATRLVQADLKKQFEERPGNEESLEPAVLRKMVVDARRWIFARDSVKVTFDPYEVGPYAAGPYEVELSYGALAPYIRTDGPLASRAR